MYLINADVKCIHDYSGVILYCIKQIKNVYFLNVVVKCLLKSLNIFENH